MVEKHCIALDLSSNQYTPFGKFLHYWYYTDKYSELRKLLEGLENPRGKGYRSVYGYPHHGGSHALTIFLTREDIIAFLEIAMDTEKSLIELFQPIVDMINTQTEVKSFISRKIWDKLNLNLNEYNAVSM